MPGQPARCAVAVSRSDQKIMRAIVLEPHVAGVVTGMASSVPRRM
ncbi:hypothetical protein [Actinomadura rugatobispora]|uniref:Uncharacterized protein n=1 Tax=Actinomadura rugatobispora TaxID=1994 RepID=A0ABW0ZL81_9ACTN